MSESVPSTDTVQSLLNRAAQLRPSDVFLIFPETGREVTFAECRALARRLCSHLRELNLQTGDVVSYLLPNGVAAAHLFLGAMFGGFVVSPLNPLNGDLQLRAAIRHSQTRMIFSSPENIGRLAAADARIAEINPDKIPGESSPETTDDPPVTAEQEALLMYTSGTTGDPKGVVLTHRNVVAGGRNPTAAHRLAPADRALCVLPLYHINGQMVTVMAPLYSGGSAVIPQKFSTGKFWNWARTYNCTWFSAVPTIFSYLLQNGGGEPAPSKMRFARSASAPLSPELHRQFEMRFGIPIVETMGLTETAAQILSNPPPPTPPRIGSAGFPVGNEAKIVDDQFKECPPTTEGEIVVRGDNVMREYLRNPQATAAAFTPDGWLRTGDLGKRDADGFFFVTGRIKELIIKGGENIAPREIDDALYARSEVAEAAAFGVADRNYGQEIEAAIVLAADAECGEKELLEFCRKSLGDFKSPRRIHFLESLPKGPSGKIQRARLAEIILQAKNSISSSSD